MNEEFVRNVLDLNFDFLETIPVDEQFKALVERSNSSKASWLEIAVVLDAGNDADFIRKLLASESLASDVTRLSASLSSEIGLSELKKHYWDTLVPQFIKNDRRRAWDYQKALLVLRKYRDELQRAGFNAYADNSFTNLLRLSRAIETRGCKPEVFESLVHMDTRAFAAFANGEDSPRESPTTIKEYIDELNRQYN